MGTRGVTGFVADGKWYVTYNHFDSYPSYLGEEVLKFCKRIKRWDRVKQNVLKVKLVSEDDTPSVSEIEECAKYADLSVYTGSLENWYCLLHDLQGVRILQEIARGKVHHMIDSHKFMADSLFCEWGYVIDLDSNVLIVYRGFQKRSSPVNILPPDISPFYHDGEYYPVDIARVYPLNELPKNLDGLSIKDD
jgi:hypothetical protein